MTKTLNVITNCSHRTHTHTHTEGLIGTDWSPHPNYTGVSFHGISGHLLLPPVI